MTIQIIIIVGHYRTPGGQLRYPIQLLRYHVPACVFDQSGHACDNVKRPTNCFHLWSVRAVTNETRTVVSASPFLDYDGVSVSNGGCGGGDDDDELRQ